jgi:Cu(I)/Ag(I) efflux system membrane fusion protein
MNNTIRHLTVLTVGAALGVAGYMLFYPESSQDSQQIDDSQPLYWVAPMDPGFRQNKPGKSPMGMDLIPVYREEENDSVDNDGVVTISPAVENNLGVRTSSIAYKPLSSWINTVGYVSYDEDKLIHIHSRVEGWLETLFIKTEGESVEKGQPLYAIYSPTLVNAQEEFLLALERNNSRLVRAAQDRMQALQVPMHAIMELKKIVKLNNPLLFMLPNKVLLIT